MFADSMEDLEITLAVRKHAELRRDCEIDQNADPSLYCPWGIMGPMDYSKRIVFSRPLGRLVSSSLEQ
jgi:hypothetical protein